MKIFFGRKCGCFPTEFKHFLTNLDDSLKNKCHSETIPGHAVFHVLSEVYFFLKFPLLLNNSIS